MRFLLDFMLCVFRLEFSCLLVGCGVVLYGCYLTGYSCMLMFLGFELGVVSAARYYLWVVFIVALCWLLVWCFAYFGCVYYGGGLMLF